MFTTQINVPAADRAQLVELLNQQLADLSDLSSQTKQAHWNVRGRRFYQYHKLFEELTGVVEAHIDELAERIATLGGYARGTVRDVARASRLEDFPGTQGDDQGYVDVLSGRFGRCANAVRMAILAAEQLDDSTTADLLTEISRGLDKSLWFLEAHLRPPATQSGPESNVDDTASAGGASTGGTSADGGSQPKPKPSARRGAKPERAPRKQSGARQKSR